MEVCHLNFESQVTIIIQKAGPKILSWVVDKIVDTGQSALIMDLHRSTVVARNHQLISELSPCSRSLDALVHQVSQAEMKDYLIIDGMELLIDSFDGPEAFVRQFSELNIRVWGEGQRTWTSVVPMICKFREGVGTSRLIVIVYADEEAESAFLDHFQDDESVEIVVISSTSPDQSIIAQRELLSALTSRNLQEALTEIETKSGVLPPYELDRFRAFAYLRHGGRSVAVEHLERAVDHLSKNDLLLLADLYGSVNRWADAFDITRRVFEDSPLMLGVAKLLLKSLLGRLRTGDQVELIGNEDVGVFIHRVISSDFENPDVLDHAANCFSQLKRYDDAARIRRQLWNKTEEPSHELLARFLDLLGHPLPKWKSAEDYVLDWSNRYPSLNDQAHQKLGMYLRDQYGSTYKAFEHLSKVSRSIESPWSYDAAVSRMKFLEDNVIALEALLLKDNEHGRAKLIEQKTRELLLDMELLSSKDKGYLVWEDFIDKSYTQQTWKVSLTKALTESIRKWNHTVTEDQVENSYLSRVSREANADEQVNPWIAVHILRKLKAQELLPLIGDSEKSMEVISGCLVHVEDAGDDLQKVWARYQVAVLWSLQGKDQDAINQSLSLFTYANRIKSPDAARTARMLAFFALSNAQFRLGQTVTGLACLLVGMRMSLELGEPGPMIEEGRNIVLRFFTESSGAPIISPQDQVEVQTFLQKFSQGMTTVAATVREALFTRDFEKVYASLSPVVYEQEYHDAEWAVHVTNLILACGQTDRRSEGRSLIQTYADEVLQLLSKRQDSLPNLMLLWSQFLVDFDGETGDVVQRFGLARRLLRTAVDFVNDRRRSLHYRAERSHLAELHRDLYLQYIEVLAFITKVIDFTEEERTAATQDLIRSMTLVNPRSLLETRQYKAEISDELASLESEYLALFNEIAGLTQNDEHKEALVLRHNKIQRDLVSRHPHYMPLPTLSECSITDVQKALGEEELFIQYVVTRHGMVTLTMSRDNFFIDMALMPVPEFREAIRQLGRALQTMDNPTADTLGAIRGSCANLSEPIVKPLLKLLGSMPDRGSRSTIYVCPDLSLEMFSSNLFATDDAWMIEKIGRVVTVLDFAQLVERPQPDRAERQQRTLVATLGNERDHVVNKARSSLLKWAGRANLSHVDLRNNKREIATLIAECESLAPCTVVMIGHGIPDAAAGVLSGATGILGLKHTIWGDDLRQLANHTEHLILLSCSSGAPYQGQVETSTGVWSAVLAENFFGVILCRWDVNVNATLAILDNVLTAQEVHSLPLSEALALAQRELIHSADWVHPFYWAGIEYWGH